MGGELGLWNEWNCKEELPWHLANLPFHQKLKHCVQRLNHLYQEHSAFWELDFSEKGFEWVDTTEAYSYFRHGKKETLLCVHNLSSKLLENVKIPCEGFSAIEILRVFT